MTIKEKNEENKIFLQGTQCQDKQKKSLASKESPILKRAAFQISFLEECQEGIVDQAKSRESL